MKTIIQSLILPAAFALHFVFRFAVGAETAAELPVIHPRAAINPVQLDLAVWTAIKRNATEEEEIITRKFEVVEENEDVALKELLTHK